MGLYTREAKFESEKGLFLKTFLDNRKVIKLARHSVLTNMRLHYIIWLIRWELSDELIHLGCIQHMKNYGIRKYECPVCGIQKVRGRRITSMVSVKREMGYREVLQGKKYYCFEEVDYGITKN